MNLETINNNDYPFQDLTSRLIGLGIEIHKILGAGFLEIVYKDAFEYEFTVNQIPFVREEEFKIPYKTTILKHRFYADFIVFENVILEIKAKEGGIAEEDYAQTINYLKCSGCKIGLILNFAKLKLEIKRVIY
jgi:GxxExxY protein